MATKNRRKRESNISKDQNVPLPRGIKLRQMLQEPGGEIGRIAWAPNGTALAIPSRDGLIRIWNVKSETVQKIKVGTRSVYSVTWSPDGSRLASKIGGKISVWDVETKRSLIELTAEQDHITAGDQLENYVAWSPDGTLLADSGSRGIRLWNAIDFEFVREHTWRRPGGDFFHPVAWSPDSKLLAVAASKRVNILDPNRLNIVQELGGFKRGIYDIAWSQVAGRKPLLAVGAESNIHVCDPLSGRTLRLLEGHTSNIESLTFSHDGRLLASRSNVPDNTIRLWDTKRWETLAVLKEEASGFWPPAISFHPKLMRLATLGDRDKSIRVWNINLKSLRQEKPKARAPRAIHHTTAKIVLVGDSGVGKTGLGWRLAHGDFKEHSSTHGQQFWVVDQLGTRRSDGTECEAILWDLAGQPDYRLTHALFLDDADLALILFDPTDSRDPLHGVEFWLKQLRSRELRDSEATESITGVNYCPIMMIGARTDRGEARLTKDELNSFCKQRDITGDYVATSAKEGTGLEELLVAMRNKIPWEQKTSIVTTVTFKRIKDYVLQLKENRRRRKVIVSPKELRKRLELTHKRWNFTDAEMMTAARHLSNYGYVRVLRTSTGEERVLLVPELLNNLAASFVLEARRNPKGLGSLEEKRLLGGSYQFRELEKLSLEEREILLDSAVLLFLEHNICFRETDPLGGKSYLVFPELINLKKPSLAEESEIEDGVAYTVSGAVENVYASLVVLLGYTQTFTRTDQWRSQARYEVGEGLICGFRQDAERDGELDLVLYFGQNVGRPVRILFQGLFESFLARRNLSVFRYEPVICSNGHSLNRAVVRDELRLKARFAFCPKCGNRVALPEANDPIQLTQTQRRKVNQQQLIAAERSRFEQALFQFMSYVESQMLTRPNCFISYAWGDKANERWVERNLARDLQKAGIDVILDRWENERVGASVPRFIAKIERCDRVILVGTPLYRTKYENKDNSSGYVVAAEVDLVANRLLGTEKEKESVLPLLLAGDKKESLPPLLHSRVFADFRRERYYFSTMFDLILDLYNISHTSSAVADLRESLRN
jgi:WD40 repeat protein